jgi:hypothetical protein
MALTENIDFVAVKKAGFYDGKHTLQQHGNIIATKNKLIMNVIYTVDAIKALTDTGDESQYREVNTPLNPFNIKKQFRAIKDAGHNVGAATKDLKSGWKESAQDLRKMRDQKKYYNLIMDIAADSSSIEEFEDRVIGLAEDHPRSLSIPVENIKEIKAGFFAAFNVVLNNGTIIKMFSLKNKKAMKAIMGKP